MNRDLRLVLTASTTRSLAIGGLSIVFGLHLGTLGFDEVELGLLIAAGLAGMALGTLIAGFFADRTGRRASLVVVCTVMSCAALALSVSDTFILVLVASFIGMINGMGRDRGPAQAVDQAIVAQATPSDKRTNAFSTYTLLQDVGTGVGSLLAGLLSSPTGYRAAFIGYAVLVFLSGMLSLRMTSNVEARIETRQAVLSPHSRRLVSRFAALSAMDSLGGGFITRTLLTYWFMHRFKIDPAWIGVLFAVASFVSAAGYLVAARLARHIGLVNTMVFTHIPSSVLLMLVPLAGSFPVAMLVFILREFLSPMDVPTRQSYLSAIVADHERTAAAGIVNMTRNASWVVGPTLAGWAMTLSFAAPLFMAGIIKIVYDLSLWATFKDVKPPEERV